MHPLFNALADYITVLSRETSIASNRPKIQKHLAAAALMFLSIHNQDSDTFKKLLESETRNYGWDYLEGDDGKQIEASWNAFREAASIF